jgi:hypothetical protein
MTPPLPVGVMGVEMFRQGTELHAAGCGNPSAADPLISAGVDL